ncbi:MAG: polysaccharide deacetylase [Sulfolobales archaeon]
MCLTFDFDAYSPWIYRKAINYTNLSRGEFASVGVRRILKLLKDQGVEATFFVPGHTAEHFPEDVGMIKDHGHEIAHHGYMHEPPETLESAEEERRVILKGIEALKKVLNITPKGYRSPSWALTKHTLSILEELGFIYDSSLMGDDYTPYRPPLYLEVDNEGRVLRGPLSKLIEIPVHWSLDDYPHFEFVRYQNLVIQGLRSVSDVLENWVLAFEYMMRNMSDGVIVYTFHPEVIGRGHTMILLERLINHIKSHARRSEIEFLKMIKVAERYREILGF